MEPLLALSTLGTIEYRTYVYTQRLMTISMSTNRKTSQNSDINLLSFTLIWSLPSSHFYFNTLLLKCFSTLSKLPFFRLALFHNHSMETSAFHFLEEKQPSWPLPVLSVGTWWPDSSPPTSWFLFILCGQSNISLSTSCRTSQSRKRVRQLLLGEQESWCHSAEHQAARQTDSGYLDVISRLCSIVCWGFY